MNLYGCIKIVPPASFRPPLAFDTENERKLPTRFQSLQKLAQGTPFHQNHAGHTFKEFQQMAREIEQCDDHLDWSKDDEVYGKIEKEYWDIVDN